ncbi:MAG: succinate dehydrogenase/fumarate reductase iron-sulfur subunit [Bdellovibrionaceae bacterium]|nr:succinate dehydrogenase/fumarate reductase iron-sulfur subunit [Pseudobdellovibrionaceae bacterium]
MTIHLKIWRQKSPNDQGHFIEHTAKNVSEHMSFLELMDVVNQELILKGDDAIEFDHDCREGICGTCSMVINGNPHGPEKATTTCQLHMRKFKDGDHITVEPFRAKAFPVVKDLKVDRTAFDKIITSGGYVSVNTGSAQDANNIPIGKHTADLAFEVAACIGCGACVAACVNGSAALFTSAKVSHMALLPQGQAEREQRVLNMVRTMESLGFGNCSNTGACELSCPKEIPLESIARMNREFYCAEVKERPEKEIGGF